MTGNGPTALVIPFPRENRRLDKAWLDLCTARWRLRHLMENRAVDAGAAYLARMQAVADAERAYGELLGVGGGQ